MGQCALSLGVFSNDYNDHSDYNDYSDYSDYSDYNDYNDYNDYSDYSDYSDYNGYNDYSDSHQRAAVRGQTEQTLLSVTNTPLSDSAVTRRSRSQFFRVESVSLHFLVSGRLKIYTNSRKTSKC